MNRQAYIDTIRQECESRAGFLLKLRQRIFAIDHYNRLLQALRLYRETIRGDPLIEREVVICLYYCDLDMRAALDYFHSEPDHTAFREAQLECSELILEILTPEFMIESG